MARSYLPGLQFVRFYAALSVIVFHTINDPSRWFGAPLVAPLAQSVFLTGGDAVALFFVLSGFLITHVILSERAATGSFSPLWFYVRRALRILPLYYAIVVLGLIIFPAVFPGAAGMPPTDRRSLLGVVALVPNLVYKSEWRHLLAHLWSIGVEEQFYLVYPVLLVSLRSVPAALFSLVAVRWVCLLVWSLNHPIASFFTFAKFDCLGIGGLGAYAVHHCPRAIRLLHHPVLQCLALVGFGAILFGKPLTSLLYDPLKALVFVTYLVNVASNPRAYGVVENRVMRALGDLSYSMYMLHVFVIFAMHHLLVGAPWYEPAMFLGCIAGTIGAAHLSFRYIETPFLRMKSRFQPRSASPP